MTYVSMSASAVVTHTLTAFAAGLIIGGLVVWGISKLTKLSAAPVLIKKG